MSLMQLTYIFHSGFVFETDQCILVFDYWMDPAGVLPRYLESSKPMYVFASHFHEDHFTPEILTWRERKDNIRYLLSKDILRHRRARKEDADAWLGKGATWEDALVRVTATGSNDSGVSWVVETGGMRLFHAGDLNNWHWMDESPEAEWKHDEAFFLRELEDIAIYTDRMDVVLFPVDPRLGREYMRGPVQFVKRIKTAIFVPMHFDEAYDKAAAFAPIAREYGAVMPEIRSRGQKISLEFNKK